MTADRTDDRIGAALALAQRMLQVPADKIDYIIGVADGIIAARSA